MKKIIKYLLTILLVCSLFLVNETGTTAKEELPKPTIGLSENEAHNNNTYTIANSEIDVVDNSIEIPIKRNAGSVSGVKKSVGKTPASFEGQDQYDLDATLPKNDALFKNVDDIGYKTSNDKFMLGEIIVCFKDECSSSVISELIPKQKVLKTKDLYKTVYNSVKKSKSFNASKVKYIEKDIGRYYVVTISGKTEKDVLNAIEELNKEPTVEYAEPNYICKPCVVPNDYNNYNLWNMNRIQMPNTWNIFPGSNVNVGVLDTGIDSTHPDLKDNINENLGWNCAEKANVDTMDYHSHGTHVSGTIGAKGNNSIGVVGVNPQAKLVPIKICFANNNSSSNDVLMAEGIGYATANGIPVCNLSYSISSDSKLRKDAIKKYGESGGTIIIAAGNNGKCIDNDPAYSSLASFENVILVANSNQELGEREKLSDSSNYGNIVHVAAPGSGIYSTVPSSYNSSGYASMSGTSMASPHVAGVVSLLKGRFPNMTPAQIKQAIMDGTDSVPEITDDIASGRLNAKKQLI